MRKGFCKHVILAVLVVILCVSQSFALDIYTFAAGSTNATNSSGNVGATFTSNTLTINTSGQFSFASGYGTVNIDTVAFSGAGVEAALILPDQEVGGTWNISWPSQASSTNRVKFTVQAGGTASAILANSFSWEIPTGVDFVLDVQLRVTSSTGNILGVNVVVRDGATMTFGSNAQIFADSSILNYPTGYTQAANPSTYTVNPGGELIIRNEWAIRGSNLTVDVWPGEGTENSGEMAKLILDLPADTVLDLRGRNSASTLESSSSGSYSNFVISPESRDVAQADGANLIIDGELKVLQDMTFYGYIQVRGQYDDAYPQSDTYTAPTDTNINSRDQQTIWKSGAGKLTLSADVGTSGGLTGYGKWALPHNLRYLKLLEGTIELASNMYSWSAGRGLTPAIGEDLIDPMVFVYEGAELIVGSKSIEEVTSTNDDLFIAPIMFNIYGTATFKDHAVVKRADFSTLSSPIYNEIYPYEDYLTFSNSMHINAWDVALNVDINGKAIIDNGCLAVAKLLGTGEIEIRNTIDSRDRAVLILTDPLGEILVATSINHEQYARNYIGFEGKIYGQGANVGLYSSSAHNVPFSRRLFQSADVTLDNLIVYGPAQLNVNEATMDRLANVSNIWLRSNRPGADNTDSTVAYSNLTIGKLNFIPTDDSTQNIYVTGLKVDGSSSSENFGELRILNYDNDARNESAYAGTAGTAGQAPRWYDHSANRESGELGPRTNVYISGLQLYANRGTGQDFETAYTNPSSGIYALKLNGTAQPSRFIIDGNSVTGDGLDTNIYSVQITEGSDVRLTNAHGAESYPLARNNSLLVKQNAKLEIAKNGIIDGNLMFEGGSIGSSWPTYGSDSYPTDSDFTSNNGWYGSRLANYTTFTTEVNADNRVTSSSSDYAVRVTGSLVTQGTGDQVLVRAVPSSGAFSGTDFTTIGARFKALGRAEGTNGAYDDDFATSFNQKFQFRLPSGYEDMNGLIVENRTELALVTLGDYSLSSWDGSGTFSIQIPFYVTIRGQQYQIDSETDSDGAVHYYVELDDGRYYFKLTPQDPYATDSLTLRFELDDGYIRVIGTSTVDPTPTIGITLDVEEDEDFPSTILWLNGSMPAYREYSFSRTTGKHDTDTYASGLEIELSDESTMHDGDTLIAGRTYFMAFRANQTVTWGIETSSSGDVSASFSASDADTYSDTEQPSIPAVTTNPETRSVLLSNPAVLAALLSSLGVPSGTTLIDNSTLIVGAQTPLATAQAILRALTSVFANAASAVVAFTMPSMSSSTAGVVVAGLPSSNIDSYRGRRMSFVMVPKSSASASGFSAAAANDVQTGKFLDASGNTITGELPVSGDISVSCFMEANVEYDPIVVEGELTAGGDSSSTGSDINGILHHSARITSSNDLFIVEFTPKASSSTQSFNVTATNSTGTEMAGYYVTFDVEPEDSGIAFTTQGLIVSGDHNNVKAGYRVDFPSGTVALDASYVWLPSWLKVISNAAGEVTGVEFSRAINGFTNGITATVTVEAENSEGDDVYYQWNVTYEAESSSEGAPVMPAQSGLDLTNADVLQSIYSLFGGRYNNVAVEHLELSGLTPRTLDEVPSDIRSEVSSRGRRIGGVLPKYTETMTAVIRIFTVEVSSISSGSPIFMMMNPEAATSSSGFFGFFFATAAAAAGDDDYVLFDSSFNELSSVPSSSSSVYVAAYMEAGNTYAPLLTVGDSSSDSDSSSDNSSSDNSGGDNSGGGGSSGSESVNTDPYAESENTGVVVDPYSDDVTPTSDDFTPTSSDIAPTSNDLTPTSGDASLSPVDPNEEPDDNERDRSDPYDTERWSTATRLSSSGEFIAFLARINNGNEPAGQYYIIDANIDLSGENWTGIGTEAHPFRGHFDGNGHTITCPASSAFFGVIRSDGVAVRNLTVRRARASSSGFRASASVSTLDGGIARVLDGGSIENCSFNGNVSVSGEDSSAGGIVGELSDGEITNCSVPSGSGISAEYSAGGIAGYVSGGEISECSSRAVVSALYSGGIAGYSEVERSNISSNTFTEADYEVGNDAISLVLTPATQDVQEGSAITPITFSLEGIRSWSFVTDIRGLVSSDNAISGTIPYDATAGAHIVRVNAITTDGMRISGNATINVTRINANERRSFMDYNFDVPAGVRSGIAAFFGVDEIYQLTADEIISESWRLDGADLSAIAGMNLRVALILPEIRPSRSGVYLLKLTLLDVYDGARIGIQGITGSSQVSSSALEGMEYAFFDENGREIREVPPGKVVYAALRLNAGRTQRSVVTAPNELSLGTIEPFEADDELKAKIAGAVNISADRLLMLKEENIGEPQDPTQGMRDEMAKRDSDVVGKMNTLLVSRDGYYVLKVTLSDDLYEQHVKGVPINELKAYVLSDNGEDGDNAEVSASFVMGLLNTWELLSLNGDKLEFGAKEFLMVGLLNAGTPFSVYLTKLLIALLLGGCDAGIGIAGLGVVAGAVILLLRRRR